MGPEMRGDVTRAADVRALVRRAQERLGGVDLYTSDAGIDVSGDYARQEELTARINLGQIVAGLLALRAGGCLVTKMYTFVSPFSLSLIALCASLFGALYVTKPATSRAANSEVYLVGVGYRPPGPEGKGRLLAALEDFDFSAPLCPLGGAAFEHTLLSLLEAARRIHLRQQVPALRRAVSLYRRHREDLRPLRRLLQAENARARRRWLAENPVRPLRPACRLHDSAHPRGQKGAPEDGGLLV
jgi:hypothetical protein